MNTRDIYTLDGGRSIMKKLKMKRILTLVLAAMMLVTAMPVGLLAETGAAGTQKKDGKFEIVYDDGT